MLGSQRGIDTDAHASRTDSRLGHGDSQDGEIYSVSYINLSLSNHFTSVLSESYRDGAS